MYSYVWMLVAWIMWILISWEEINLLNFHAIFYAFSITAFYLIIIKTRLKSLRYLSSSTYFINYRIISSLWLIILWMLAFWETISLKEALGIALGFVVFYLLLEKKNDSETLSDLKKGFFYLFLGSFAVMGVQWLGKDFALSGDYIFTLMFFQWIFWILTAVATKGNEKIRDVFAIQDSRQWIFLLLSAALFGWATMCNVFAYITGDLAIVYKVISYSLFIPIILSIIFYKEQVTKKKLLAFALTVISIFLFI